MKVFCTGICGRWGSGEGVKCCEREKGGKATSVSDSYSPEGLRNVGTLRQLGLNALLRASGPKGTESLRRKIAARTQQTLQVTSAQSLCPVLLSPLKM